MCNKICCCPESTVDAASIATSFWTSTSIAMGGVNKLVCSLFPEVYVGNLDANLTEEELRQVFLQGKSFMLRSLLPSKGCGFVPFAARNTRELEGEREAEHLNGN